MSSRRREPQRLSRRTKQILAVLAVFAAVLMVLSALDARGTLDGTPDDAALRPGDRGDLTDGQRSFPELLLVDCSEPHDVQVVGLLGARVVDDEHSATDLCLDALDDFADPELLALTRVDPRTATYALSAPYRNGSTDKVWRCLLDVRESPAEPRSLAR